MIALEPAKTPAAKRRDRFYRSRFFVVFRRRKPTFSDGGIRYISTAKNFTIQQHFSIFSDGVIFYISTAEPDIIRRRYPLYFDGRKFYNPTAFFDIFRRRYFLYFDGIFPAFST